MCYEYGSGNPCPNHRESDPIPIAIAMVPLAHTESLVLVSSPFAHAALVVAARGLAPATRFLVASLAFAPTPGPLAHAFVVAARGPVPDPRFLMAPFALTPTPASLAHAPVLVILNNDS